MLEDLNSLPNKFFDHFLNLAFPNRQNLFKEIQ